MSEREAMPFSGSVLKCLAIAVMFLDHIGACLLEVFVLNVHGNSPLAGQIGNLYFWYDLDQILRSAGRMAFPIFCFLLVEGALHTRSPKKYLICCGWRSLRLFRRFPLIWPSTTRRFTGDRRMCSLRCFWGFW